MSCNCAQRDFLGKPCGGACETCIPVVVDNESILFSTSPDFAAFDLTNTNWTELTVNGCVSVPEVKPSIEAIHSVHTQIEIVRKKVVVAPSVNNTPATNIEGKRTTGRKLIVEGLICSTISYVSTYADQSVHTFHGKIPFSAYIILPLTWGTTEVDVLDINFNVTGFVEDTMVKSACERNVCLCVTFILQPVPAASATCNNNLSDTSGICCSLATSSCACNNLSKPCDCEDPIIKGISPQAQIEILLTNVRERLWTELFVPEILNIPSCKPDLQKILSVTSKLEILCQKVIATPSTPVDNFESTYTTGRKLIIEGVLRQRITYISCTETESVHSAHFDVPVSTFIILPSTASLTDRYRLSTVIEDIFVCGLNERQIFKNTTLFIKATEITC